MSLTMVHIANGNITHSSNQTPCLSRRGSMGINYAPYISLVFMPHVRRRENDGTNQPPAKQRMASLTNMITKLIKFIITYHTHTRTHTEHTHTYLLQQNCAHIILLTTEYLYEIKTKLRTVSTWLVKQQTGWHIKQRAFIKMSSAFSLNSHDWCVKSIATKNPSYQAELGRKQ